MKEARYPKSLAAVLGALTTMPFENIPNRDSKRIRLTPQGLSYRTAPGTWKDDKWVHGGPLFATEALEKLEIIPHRDASRKFLCESCGGSGIHKEQDPLSHLPRPLDCLTCMRRKTLPYPSTIPSLVSWSCLGMADIMRAEWLAREMCTRLAPWGVPPCENVLWLVGRPELPDIITPPRWGTYNIELNADEWQKSRFAAEEAGDPWWVCWWVAWIASWPPGDPRKCPHEPMLELIRMGVFADRIDKGVVTLVVPRVGGP